MTSKLIDGKKTSAHIEEQLRIKVQARVKLGKRPPHLCAVLVGNDGASEVYVANKVKACARVGYESTLIRRDASITEEALLKLVDQLNRDENIDGFIVQLPLPSHIDEQRVIEAISPHKDVDGFHPNNAGKMMLGLPGYKPATPFGVMQLLDYYKIETEGKHCVVIGRSNIVGTPISVMLSRNSYPGNCTVTLAHSKTKGIKELCLTADIIICALGRPGFLTGDMVKEGVVAIDVGTTRVADPSKKSGYRLRGDVDFESVSSKASYISPVPGGVGPMTIASLLMNCWQASELLQTSPNHQL